MKISFNTMDIAPHTGYGRAAMQLKKHMKEQDVQFTSQSNTMLNFCMPNTYIHKEFTIGYTPWESTELRPSWAEEMKLVDELWTTSRWTKEIFEHETGRNDVWVLPHGIDDNWIPTKHFQRNQTFTFLHVGEPAVRKGGDVVLNAWYKAFRSNKNCKLIYKATGIPMARVKDRGGSILASPPSMDNVEVINEIWTDLQMWRLYVEANCMVYPTRGEGFGFIPLESMASGLPTIFTNDGGTKGYPGIPLNHNKWTDSGQAEHPGKWISPDVDEVIDRMLWVMAHYDQACEDAFLNAREIHQDYSWKTVAKSAIDRIKSI